MPQSSFNKAVMKYGESVLSNAKTINEPILFEVIQTVMLRLCAALDL